MSAISRAVVMRCARGTRAVIRYSSALGSRSASMSPPLERRHHLCRHDRVDPHPNGARSVPHSPASPNCAALAATWAKVPPCPGTPVVELTFTTALPAAFRSGSRRCRSVRQDRAPGRARQSSSGIRWARTTGTALLRQNLADRRPDPGGAAGYDHNLARKPQLHLVPLASPQGRPRTALLSAARPIHLPPLSHP